MDVNSGDIISLVSLPDFNINTRANIDEKKYLAGIKEIKIKEKLKNLTSLAFKNDVFGAPTFVVNDKLFWGQDRLEYALDEYNT